MFESGLLDEVKSLIVQGITEENQCMQGIGYKEIFGYLNSNKTFEETKELIKLNSRHYAKRQITFFKRLDGLNYLKPDDVKNLARRIVEDYDR